MAKLFEKAPNKNFRKIIILTILVISFFPISFIIYSQILIAKARAEATIVWDGGGDGSSWSDGLNWSTDVVPSTEDIVLIDTTTTVNINAPITIASLLIGRSNGSVSPVLNFAYDGINSGALTINNGDLIVYSNASITHTIGTNVVVGRVNINVSNGNAQIYGNINVNGKGFAKGQGDSPGVADTSGAGGGSHGGIGGHGNGASGVGGLISYGSMTAPVNIGSGGGIGSVPNPDTLVSNGGGAVKLVVSGTLTVNGSITANGDIGPTRSAVGVGAHGGGAGGSIWLDASSFAGTGNITAQGGNASAGNGSTRGGGSGGGGRIALHYSTDTSSLSTLSASGGKPDGTALSSILLTKGGAGTVYKKDKDLTKGEVIIDNKDTDWSTLKSKVGLTPLPNNLDINSLVVRNYSNVEYGSTLASSSILVETLGHLSYTGSVSTTDLQVITNGSLYNESTGSLSYSSLNWTGGKLIDNGGTLALLSGGGSLTIPASSELSSNVARSYTDVLVNGVLTHSNNVDTELYKINISTSGDFTVSNTGSINVSGKGYAMGYGLGAGVNGNNGAGGGAHGGNGGNGQTRAGGTAYGNNMSPDKIGSGGGYYEVFETGSAGGGAVKINSTGTVTINGVINANGLNGIKTGHGSGGGAGGSIWIISDIFTGTGSLSATGGSTINTTYDGGGGGGGRIALFYRANESNLTSVSVTGGQVASGSVALLGADGTVVWGGRPYNPSNLRQFKNDGSTGIAVGESTDEVVFIARLLLQDDDSTDTLTVEVECLPVGSSFTNVATHTGTPVSYIGTPINADVTVDGLADKATYHWQARVCDASLLCSDWTSFGANLENEVDLRIGSNSAPNSPVIPESSYYINGSLTNNTKPTIGFVLTDSNSSDTVGYKFQLDDSDDFNTPIVDYESTYSAQGTQWFTIGQAEGDGEYIVGSESDELVTGSYYWRVKTYDDKGAESSWTVATGDPSFRIDLTRPTNASDVKIKSHAGGINMYAESDGAKWFSRIDPFFSWADGSDDEGVKGYCLYLGQNPDGDPATEKGILGSSPVSTTGTSCQFIINDTEIDFANSAYRTVGWLSSSEDKYYFKVKTIDVANNVYVGEDDTNFVSFKFDSTAPQNVTSISSASSTFSSTADMYFSWTTGVENGASDDHSDLMGFQYAVNSRDEWFGGYIDDFTGISYLPINTLQPYYLGQDAQEKIQLGQNTLFFRVVDFAGNYSELRTTILNYGGEAPNFAQGSEVDVNPDSSDDNNFEFSWPEASVSEGNIFSTYYYMVNTPPPLLYSTITSNSATYIPTTDNFVTQRSFPGLRKGSNIVYVVAVDEAGNYSSSNYISGIFYLDTELPDPPTNVMVSDSSIKDASIWRVAIVWDDPVYKGTGTITYIVQRSEDGQDWTNIAETTATAYVDTVPESSRYYWRVATVDNSDESKASPSYSNAVSTIPRGKYLVAPSLTSGPAVSSITTTKAKFSWTTNRSSDSKISFGLASGNYFDWEPSYSAHVTDHIISLSNLEPGKTYYYRARWTDEDGNTGVSEEKSFTTEDPPTVKDVRITNLGISGAIVNFTTINASKAKIYFGITPDFGGAKEIATSKIETSYSVALDSLQDGTKYYFKINTFDEEEAEYSGTTLDFTTMPRPKVTNVIVQQVAKTAEATLLVTWDSNTSVSSIVTYYPEKNPELVKDAVDIDLKNGQHKMILRGLFPDTSYVITVRGRDIIGNEAVSNSIRVVTSEDTRAPLISNLSVEGSNIKITDGGSESTTSQLIITWSTDELSTSQVEYGEGSGSSYSQLTQQDNSLSTNHVVIISGLNPSKVYHFRAISKDSAGNESRSVDTVTITPKATDNAFDLVVTTLKEVFRFLNEL